VDRSRRARCGRHRDAPHRCRPDGWLVLAGWL
jgi:hypothetical protein